MLLPALLLAPALLLPTGSAHLPAPGAVCAPAVPGDVVEAPTRGPACPPVAEAVVFTAGRSLGPRAGSVPPGSDGGHAAQPGAPVAVQTPATTPPPATPAPAPGAPGSGLQRWQAAVIAVVVAGAVVWLVGRLRRLGRRG